jgi:uncharacterized protein (TIGR03435 family)
MRRRDFIRGVPMNPLRIVSLFVIGIASLNALAQRLPTETEAFEAASLHPLQPGTAPNVSGVAAALDPSLAPDGRAPSLLSGDLTLFDLVVCAYAVRDSGMQPGLMKQLPSWAGKDTVHLSARLHNGATVLQMRQMLQTLLRERYRLAVHEETRTIPVLLLEVDPKKPSRLKPHDGACTSDSKCGTHTAFATEAVHVQFVGVTLDDVAAQLGGFAWYAGGLRYGPVVNATALQGRFDGDFTFTPLMKADVEGGPTLSEGLRNELGLNLQKGMHAMPLLIVDHVEPATFD